MSEKTLIRKSLQENQEKVSSLDSEQGKLEAELALLSEKLESEEVTLAKVNVLTRQAEEFLAGANSERAEELKSQITQIREHRERTIGEIKAVNEKIGHIQNERRVFVKGLLYECHPRIKEHFGSMLEATLIWIEQEVAECSQVASENGIVLPSLFQNELRIWQQGPLIGGVDWRPLRDHLNRWIP
jgi:hypothetical protein